VCLFFSPYLLKIYSFPQTLPQAVVLLVDVQFLHQFPVLWNANDQKWANYETGKNNKGIIKKETKKIKKKQQRRETNKQPKK
jgi:hypothetical protein